MTEWNAEITTEVIDIQKLYQQFAGDEEILLCIAEECLNQLPTYIANIRNAIEAENSQALHDAAHTFKGSISNFRAPVIDELALKLEQMGRNKELTEAKKTLSSLEEKITLFQKELETLQEKAAA